MNKPHQRIGHKSNTFVAKESTIDRVIHHWMHKQPACCLWGIIGLDEPLSDEIIEKTLEILIDRVPIISARLKKGLWSGYWEFVEPGDIKTLMTKKRASDAKEADRLLNEVIRNSIDADNPPVIRVTSIDLPDDHFFVLQVHHTVMDGEGAKQLFNLFAKIYRELENDPEWLPDNFPVMDRSWFQIAKYLKWHRFLIAPFIAFKEFVIIIYILLNLRKIASVIIGDFPEKNKGFVPENPQMETFVINKNEMETINFRLNREGAKVNDLIMAALMTTVNAWNSACGKRFSRVLSGYTVDLRRWWGQPEGKYANMSAVCIALANTEDLADVHKAIKTLKPKFDKAKKEFGLKELWDVLSLKIQPEVISRIAAFFVNRLVKITHALTNIGIIPESAGNFGRIKARSYSMVAPFFPRPNLFFTATSYKDDLTVHCNFNGTHMRAETARNLMGQFKDNMLEFSRVS
ncbi:MAG: condensation domain-containing protein [Pseudomonadota bacterium]